MRMHQKVHTFHKVGIQLTKQLCPAVHRDRLDGVEQLRCEVVHVRFPVVRLLLGVLELVSQQRQPVLEPDILGLERLPQLHKVALHATQKHTCKTLIANQPGAGAYVQALCHFSDSILLEVMPLQETIDMTAWRPAAIRQDGSHQSAQG